MRFYDSLPENPSRQDLDRCATLAIGRLALAVGLTLSGERIAAIIQTLHGRGYTIRAIEEACVSLAVCTEFAEKLRYGGTLTPADIIAKADMKRVAVDPARAIRERETVWLGHLLEEHKDIGVAKPEDKHE